MTTLPRRASRELDVSRREDDQCPRRLWPTARAERPLFDDPEADFGREKKQTEARPAWLEDSVRRQKAGFKITRDYGPVERENYN